ncbi:MAG: aminodeoxychorismate synthase component I [Actinomycetota bacterium]|nr:aminodeoxychorismate synthase component I [Actinomycetota bacterium]
MARTFRHDPWPFALIGTWAGGGSVIGSAPLRVAHADDDPFEVLNQLPTVEGPVDGTVGGGWVGYLGFQLGGRVERLPSPPPRRVPLPEFSLAFYDHVLHYDHDSDIWWFEALWSPRRATLIESRLELFSTRLAAPPEAANPYRVRDFTSVPDPEEHGKAIRRCIDYIHAGDIFQANLCIRLEANLDGDPLDLFLDCAGKLHPRYAGFVAGPWGAIASLSPELFLERRGRGVRSAPIKGTCPRSTSNSALERERLLESAKDLAENVMIVDLMRNDFGRVCAPGSIRVPSLAHAEAHPGVWHLVSEVTGELRDSIDDATLLRATFPPGSVSGAPKVRAMEIISEVETTAREAYTGSIGYVSPVAGLELNVAIRTFEFGAGQVWLGVGGGIVADSDPTAEVQECFTKALPLIQAAGGFVESSDLGGVRTGKGEPFRQSPEQPDPRFGVFETLLGIEGTAVEMDAHLERLSISVEALYKRPLPMKVRWELDEAMRDSRGVQRLRLSVWPRPDGQLESDLRLEAVDSQAVNESADVTKLVIGYLSDGLGPHKWRDRGILSILARAHPLSAGEETLIIDDNGEVLETARGNVFALLDATLVTPATDGRILPGVTRARILSLARELGVSTASRVIELNDLRRAEEVFVTSSIRGVTPVASCQGVGTWPIGSLTTELRKELSQYWANSIPVIP